MNDFTADTGARPWHRLHASSWLILLLTLSALGLWIASGFVTFEPLDEQMHWRHGWPWTYLTRQGVWGPAYTLRPTPPNSAKISSSTVPAPPGAIATIKPRPEPIWGFTHDVVKFRPGAMAADGVAALLAAFVVALAFECRRRRRPRLFSFSLKEFLAASALLALTLGYGVHLDSQHRRNLELANKLNLQNFVGEIDHGAPGWLWVMLPGRHIKFGDTIRGMRWNRYPEGLNSLPPDSLGTVTELKDLRALRIYAGYPSLNDDAHYFEQMPQLVVLDLAHTNISDAGFAHVAALPNLQVLGIGREVTDAGLAHVAGLKKLQRIEMELNARLNGDGLVHFANLPRLESLKLGPKLMTDEAWRNLARLTQLKELVLNVPVSDTNLRQLRGLKQLESLEINSMELSDDGLAALANFPRLRELTLQGRFTNEALRHLVVVRQLEVLELKSTRITVAGLDPIAEFPSLKLLIWRGAYDYPKEIAELQQKRPMLQVRSRNSPGGRP